MRLFSRWRIARRRMYGSATSFTSIAAPFADEAAAQRPVREADPWSGSGGTGRFPQRQPGPMGKPGGLPRERAEGERRSSREREALELEHLGAPLRECLPDLLRRVV